MTSTWSSRGNVNSTGAVALVCAKLRIPVAQSKLTCGLGSRNARGDQSSAHRSSLRPVVHAFGRWESHPGYGRVLSPQLGRDGAPSVHLAVSLLQTMLPSKPLLPFRSFKSFFLETGCIMLNLSLVAVARLIALACCQDSNGSVCIARLLMSGAGLVSRRCLCIDERC